MMRRPLNELVDQGIYPRKYFMQNTQKVPRYLMLDVSISTGLHRPLPAMEKSSLF